MKIKILVYQVGYPYIEKLKQLLEMIFVKLTDIENSWRQFPIEYKILLRLGFFELPKIMTVTGIKIKSSKKDSSKP